MQIRGSAALFLAAQGALYLVFVYRDLFCAGAGTVLLKYAGIVLCLLFSLYWSIGGGDWLVTAALALTLAADTLLLLLDEGYFLGVLLFCLVQGLYLLRICRANGGRALWPLQAGLLLVSLAALGRLGLLTALNVLSLLYFGGFLCNVVLSLGLRGGRGRLFALGLCLFLCCDLCVGLFNFPLSLPARLHEAARVGMWLFYLPGQVLITLSGRCDPDTARSAL